jgi:RimJ/RimL family protein N-acetyltransferase
VTGVRLRRAEADDVDFLVELLRHEDVKPFLGAASAADRASVTAEVERSLAEPHDFGRFVIEADGRRAGMCGFELVNRRSAIAHLERLAVHPSFRGRRISDAAARIVQRHLLHDLGYHRLQLEIYGFNERAQQHAERSGYVREGAKRNAYRRHGGWVDGILYGIVAEDVELPDAVRLLHDHLLRFNDGVRTGDWRPMLELFAEDAELVFEGVPAGPFSGRDAIAAAYEAQPPDDEIVTLRVDAEGDDVTALYAWRREPARVAGRLVLTPRGAEIARFLVTFEDGLDWRDQTRLNL